MSSARLMLAVLLVPCAISCGRSKPEPVEAKTKAGQETPTGVAELRGRWKSVDARRPVLGEFLGDPKKPADTHVVLSFRGKYLEVTDHAGFGAVIDYKVLDNGKIELSQDRIEFSLPATGSAKEEPKEKEEAPKEEEPKKPSVEKKLVKQLNLQVGASALVLSDDAGKSEKFSRLPVESATIKIDNLALYGDACVDQLKQALAEVPGLSDLAVDRQRRQVTLKLKDREDRDVVFKAIEKAGMHGAAEINGKPVAEFSPVGLTLDGKPKPVNQIVLKQIHACCPQCRQAIIDLAPGGTVKFAGAGPTATATITGDALDRDKIVLNLWRAGFRIVDR